MDFDSGGEIQSCVLNEERPHAVLYVFPTLVVGSGVCTKISLLRISRPSLADL